MSKEMYCNTYVHILAVDNNSKRKSEVVCVRGIEVRRRWGIGFHLFLTSVLMDRDVSFKIQPLNSRYAAPASQWLTGYVGPTAGTATGTNQPVARRHFPEEWLP